MAGKAVFCTNNCSRLFLCTNLLFRPNLKIVRKNRVKPHTVQLGSIWLQKQYVMRTKFVKSNHKIF